MDNLDYEEIADILEDYTIYHKDLGGVKGDVDFDLAEIAIDSTFGENIETLIHEFAHIYYEDLLELKLSEDIIERVSQNYLKENPSAYAFLNCYLNSRIVRKRMRAA